MGVERQPPHPGIDVGGHIEVLAVLAVGEAEQVGQGDGVLEHQRAVADARVQLSGIGAGVARGKVARVVVLQDAQVHRHAFRQIALVAAVEVHFHGRGHVGVAVAQPTDAGVPIAQIEAAGVGQVKAALDGGLVVRLHQAAIAVLACQGKVGRQREVAGGGRGSGGGHVAGLRGGCQAQQRKRGDGIAEHGVLLVLNGIATIGGSA
ncbi:hypothetical protein D3C85_299930 [compost metagenome]